MCTFNRCAFISASTYPYKDNQYFKEKQYITYVA